MKKSLSFLLIGAAVVLAACGGSSNDTEDVPPATTGGAVPSSATASIQAFVTYLGSLVLSETALPLTVEGIDPPTSETAAPLPLT